MSTNLVLIGMPGSGKTTIGKQISQALNMKFIDLDEEIERKTQQTIAQLFEKGEAHFRKIESEVTQEVAQMENTVIAAGGGIILRNSNMLSLTERGTIIFLNRSPEAIIKDIDHHTRPLLKESANRLYQLYDARINLYRKYANITVNNFENIETTLTEVLSKLPETFIERIVK